MSIASLGDSVGAQLGLMCAPGSAQRRKYIFSLSVLYDVKPRFIMIPTRTCVQKYIRVRESSFFYMFISPFIRFVHNHCFALSLFLLSLFVPLILLTSFAFFYVSYIFITGFHSVDFYSVRENKSQPTLKRIISLTATQHHKIVWKKIIITVNV